MVYWYESIVLFDRLPNLFSVKNISTHRLKFIKNPPNRPSDLIGIRGINEN
jgi:hypothetical protein